MKKRLSQTDKILEHLKVNGTITSWEAINLYRCTRLSAKIYDLRNLGYNITTKMVTKKNSNGEYVTYGIYELLED